MLPSRAMATPTELRGMADRADTEADGLEAQARTLRQQAIELRRLAAAGDEGLKSIPTEDTVGISKMEAQATASAGAKKAWAKIQDALPFQVALFRRGMSLPEWARKQRRPPISSTPARSVETAKSWVKKRGHGGNRIPEEWAARIAKQFVDEKGRSEVPAVDASWPCGIRPARV